MNNQLSFDGPNIEELLEQVQRELGPDVTIVDARQFRRGGVAGFFAKEWYEITVEVDPSEGDRDEGVTSDGPGPGTTTRPAAGQVETGELDPLIEWALAVDDRQDTSFGDDNDPDGRSGAGGPQDEPVSADAFALALASAHREAVFGVGSSNATGSRAGEDRPAASTATATAPTTVARSSTTVPAPRTARLRDLELSQLLAHLETLVPSRTLPERSDPVIAVVGETSSAGVAAAALAAGYGLDSGDVLIARPESVEGTPPWVELTTPTQARSRARRWADCGHATVVVVELSPGREGHAWAASMLAAIGADQVRLVARAWQLTDQLQTKSLALGGVDGLDVVEVDTAAEPELFLELDLPVFAFDGRPATSELWAALLYERRIDEHRDA